MIFQSYRSGSTRFLDLRRSEYATSDPNLASAHESQANGYSPALASAIGQEVGRIDVVIHYVGITVVGEIVQSDTPSPEVMQEAEPSLEMEIDVEVGGQTPSIGVADQESF